MTVFKWDHRYESGVPEMDNEHKALVTLTNDLFEALGHGDGSKVGSTLDSLAEYAVVHFSKEDEYMRQTAYPNQVVHAAQHVHFVQSIARFQRRVGLESNLVMTFKLCSFLEEWFREHLLGEDRELFKHVASVPPPAKA